MLMVHIVFPTTHSWSYINSYTYTYIYDKYLCTFILCLIDKRISRAMITTEMLKTITSHISWCFSTTWRRMKTWPTFLSFSDVQASLVNSLLYIPDGLLHRRAIVSTNNNISFICYIFCRYSDRWCRSPNVRNSPRTLQVRTKNIN